MVDKESKRGIVVAVNSKLGNEGFQLQEDGKWHNIIGKATKFVRNIQKNCEIEYTMNYKGDIVFFKQVTDVPTAPKPAQTPVAPAPKETPKEEPKDTSKLDNHTPYETKRMLLCNASDSVAKSGLAKSLNDLKQFTKEFYHSLLEELHGK